MLKGKLRLISGTSKNSDCELSYDFVTDEGKVFEDLENTTNAPINERIAIKLIDSKIVSWDYIGPTVMAYRHNMVKDVALVRIVEEGRMSNEHVNIVTHEAKELEDFYHQVNDGLWENIVVTPYVVENKEGQSVGLHTFHFSTVMDRLREQHPEKVDQHNYWHGWGGYSSSNLGLAFVDGEKAWTYLSGPQRTMRHEQGHNFGCSHSQTEHHDYGDPTCIMAKAHSGFNAPQSMILGQLREDNRLLLEKNKDSVEFLCPVEVPSIDVRQNEYQAISILLSARRALTISTRKPSYQSIRGIGEGETVYIHETDRKIGGEISKSSPTYKTSITKGESFEYEGVTIKNVDSKEGVVKVEINNPSANDDKDFPEPLSDVHGEKMNRSHSKVWNNPQYKFQGLDLFVIEENEHVVGYWFTHNPHGETNLDGSLVKKSSREWYVLDGYIDLETNMVNCSIISTLGREDEIIGHGSIRLSDNELLFRYYTKNHGRDHMFLQPLTETKQETVTGVYETGEREGYSVAKYENYYVAYHYTYQFSDNDLEWSVYQGSNINNLLGYKPDGRYKITYEKDLNAIEPIDLEEIINNATKVC